jgi:dTDP-4-amino-4,6-dideoxygalactose transaminase
MSGIEIPISAVDLGEDVEQSVLRVLRSGVIAQGPVVAALEDGFRELAGTTEAVAVNSGTTALVLALEALGVGQGDEVVTSPLTFAATLNAILGVGATARFADIDDFYTLDADQLDCVLTSATRAILPVHLYGQPVDMPALMRRVEGRDVHVVEDAAQAHGAVVADRPVGSFGVGCFSLYATKNLTAGEGGVVTTSDPDLAARMRVLRNQGMRERYEYVVPGHNYRLTDLQAAVAVPQLRALAARTARRRSSAERLTAGLRGVPGITLPAVAQGRSHVWHQYTVRISQEARLDRAAVVEALARRGIGSGVYYPRVVFDYDCYRQHPRVVVDEVPRAVAAAREVLSLPVHPKLTDDDLDRVIEAVRKVLDA